MDLSFVVLVVSLVWIASEVILSRFKRSREGGGDLDRSSFRLLWIAITAGVTGGVLLSRQPAGRWVGAGVEMGMIALVLIVAGLALRWFAILSLKQHFTVDVAIVRDHRIVKSGVYGILRHPAYAGTLLSFFGLGIYFMNTWSLLVLCVPVTAAFLYRIRVEETALTDAFGEEYRTYQSTTKRLIPGIY